MNLYTFEQQGGVPSGVVMHLTAEQANARRHFLTPADIEAKGSDKGWHPAKAKADLRLGFTGSKVAVFIPGEVIGLDGPPDAGLRTALGVAPEGPTAAPRDASGTAGEKKALTAAKAAAAAAEGALETLRGELAGLGEKLVAAQADLTAAEALQAEAKDAAAKAAAEAAVTNAEDALGQVENEIGTFLARFVPPAGKDEDAN